MKEELSLEPIQPTKPVAPWRGGKRALAKRLGERIAQVPHERYVEPFVGMGGVFFRRDRRAKLEVINDISQDVVNLFRILQRHYQQFLDQLKFQTYSRAEFERLKATDPNVLTDLERAARFLYMQVTSFGGMGSQFGIDYARPRWNLQKIVPLLEDVHERLSGVLIERLPYAECIRKYDSRPGALFYCDPPYWGCEDDYGRGLFSADDFARLRDLLGSLQGRFILSINDTPEIREIFKGLPFEEVGLNYRLSGKVTPARELIISSRDP